MTTEKEPRKPSPEKPGKKEVPERRDKPSTHPYTQPRTAPSIEPPQPWPRPRER